MSGDELVLAVDAGSGSCRAAVFDAAGRLHRIVAEEWRHPREAAIPGARRFDAPANWDLVCRCIGRASADVPAGTIRAVSTTSFRGGLVAFDRAGEALWACPNDDARAGAEARALVEEGAATVLQARGGDWVSLTAPARLRWLRDRAPDVWRDAARFGLVNDWLIQRLSGRLVTDPSVGSSSGLFDLRARTWSTESLALCDLGPAVLPEVADTGTIVGEVTRAAATATGLPAGTPVILGGADTALGLVGLGVEDAGRCVALGGTFWQQSLTTAEPRLDPTGRLRTLCHALDDQWLVEGIGFYCGLALRWFRDAFCAAESAEARRLGVDAYDVMEREAAAAPPGAHGVVAILSNAMDAQHWTHAPPAFIGFDLERSAESAKPAFIRAILEAAAFVVRTHVEQLEAIAGSRFPRLLLAGGAGRGRLWPQIIADVLRRDVMIPDRAEATVRGAALAAGVGAGWYPDLRGAATAAAPLARRVAAPDATAADTYDALHGRWRRIYAGMLPLAAEGSLAPLWRAPGA